MAYSSIVCKDCGNTDLQTNTSPCPQCGSMRLDVILTPDPVVLTLTVVSPTLIVTEYHELLFNFAQSLVNQSPYGVSVVVAHMACEMAVERVVTKFNPGAPQSVKMYGYNLRSDDNRRAYAQITNDNNIQQESFWQKFIESAKRRNRVVHARHVATFEEARESLEATEALIKYLKQKFNMPWN